MRIVKTTLPWETARSISLRTWTEAFEFSERMSRTAAAFSIAVMTSEAKCPPGGTSRGAIQQEMPRVSRTSQTCRAAAPSLAE
jgi:hypothetical protein